MSIFQIKAKALSYTFEYIEKVRIFLIFLRMGGCAD